jgi:tetratricopeptide (TPR) repeat protein
LKDIFKVQGDIAGTVAQALNVVLTEGGGSREKQEANTEAYNALLQGNFFFARRSKQDVERAVGFFKQAINLDREYAMAWQRLGSAYMSQIVHRWVPAAEGSANAKDALTRALRIDPRLMSARVSLFMIHSQIDWNWTAARADIERMREISPDDEFSTRYCAAVLRWLFTGNTDEVIDFHRRQLDRDPLATFTMRNLENRLFEAGRFEESVAISRKLLQLSPSYAGIQAGMGMALLYLDQKDLALAAIERETDERYRLAALPIVYWALGRRSDSDAALHAFENSFAEHDSIGAAEARAYRGETDAALRWLDRAYAQRDIDLLHIKSDSLLSNLHSDPRFRAFLVKLKLDGQGPEAPH